MDRVCECGRALWSPCGLYCLPIGQKWGWHCLVQSSTCQDGCPSHRYSRRECYLSFPVDGSKVCCFTHPDRWLIGSGHPAPQLVSMVALALVRAVLLQSLSSCRRASGPGPGWLSRASVVKHLQALCPQIQPTME